MKAVRLATYSAIVSTLQTNTQTHNHGYSKKSQTDTKMQIMPIGSSDT